jgi:hypothetical protein
MVIQVVLGGDLMSKQRLQLKFESGDIQFLKLLAVLRNTSVADMILEAITSQMTQEELIRIQEMIDSYEVKNVFHVSCGS